MADPRLVQSIERLERAVAALESGIGTRLDHDAAAPRDEQLRAEVRAAIDELDRMIAVRHG